MSVVETVFWFVVVPALIIVVVGGLAWVGGYPKGFAAEDGGDGPGGKRYRPGRPYDAAPVWFLSAPEKVDQAANKRAALAGKAASPSLPAGAGTGGQHATPQGSTGGASDRW